MEDEEFQKILEKIRQPPVRFNHREMRGIPEKVDSYIVCSIPYAIPIIDGPYKVHHNGQFIEFDIKRLQKNMPPSKLITGPNFNQRPYDRYGQSAISFLKFKIPYYVDFQDRNSSSLIFPESERSKTKEMVVEIINILVDKVRYFLEEFWLEPVRYQDLENVSIEHRDEEKSYGITQSWFDTGLGGISLTGGHPYLLSSETQDELNSFLMSDVELDLSKILLMNVKNECLKGDFRHALIEAVIALEYTLYNFVRKEGTKFNLSKNKLDGLIKSIGLKECLDTLLKIIVEEDKLPEKKIVECCKGGITKRNKIIHDGKYDLNTIETEQQILAIEDIINHINQL